MNDNQGATARQLNILVADHNDGFRAAFVAVLRAMGHRAEGVRDGRQVLSAATRGRFDIVFIDVEMTEIDGREPAEALHEGLGRDCPWIVAHSGAVEGREYFAAFAMDDSVSRAVHSDDLRRVLRRLDCAITS